MAWWHDGMMTWWHDDMMAWWQNDKMTKLQNDKMTKWQNDKMSKWQNDILIYTFVPLWERYTFLELLSIQMSEPNNRPTMRNINKAKSQTSSLINQRCRLSFIAKCVSLSHAVCGCWLTLSSVSTNTRTRTLYLSLSLCYLLSFPIFPFHLKALSVLVWSSIEIQISPYSVVLIS
jgi:hypothetical protein